eukprot:scaffold320638_cov46-Prasinocladus_malaysianus.AAC.4
MGKRHEAKPPALRQLTGTPFLHDWAARVHGPAKHAVVALSAFPNHFAAAIDAIDGRMAVFALGLFLPVRPGGVGPVPAG